MKNVKIIILPAIIALTVFGSCVKMDSVGVLNPGTYTDTTAALKDATDVNLGVAVDFKPSTTDATYAAVVKRDFDGITCSYEMKHGAIVQANGALNFTNADALLNVYSGSTVFGHTLGWYQNQNATYLKSYAGITVPAATELLLNGGFELGGAANFTNWSTYNAANGATINVGSGANEVRTGTRSLKVINPVANPGNQYKVQLASDLFNTTVGNNYAVTYWVKAASAGGSIRLSTGTTAQYQGDQTIGTAWQQITWTIQAKDAQTRILFDMGQAANTYYIDDASVKEVIAAPSGSQVALKVDTALGNFITGMVNHYKTKVHAWDVVNELFTDNGSIRNNTNTAASASNTDWFVWSEYLGRDYALKAFNYAKAADPTATLFINDYGLESNNQKLDSLIAYVNEIKAKGAKVDGIGTQMHISWNTGYAGIDAMFKKLAATGLQVRISELDVKINPIPKVGFVLTPLEAAYQADMYKYAVKSYLTNVPKAQQFGITIWGVTDNTSWLYNNGQDFPLIYNANYSRKAAYAAVLQALQGK